MPAVPPAPTAASAAKAEKLRDRWLGTFAVLACLWAMLVNQLRVDWSINPQYSYGWLVPFLAAYLFWKRWPTRPEPASPAFLPALGFAAAALAIALFPTRLVQEASPDWSVVSWALALEVVGLTLAALALFGGWRTARHFAWPICFFLVAVPWPVRFETALTQSLMQQLAALTSELLSWAGISAVPQGNLIRLSGGVIGVDEACSGVRSLQSMLMGALFLAELHRFPPLARVGLVVIGLALAILFNVARALALVTVALRHGLTALEKWHDSAGYSILLVSFLALCGFVRLFRIPPPAEPAAPPVGAWRPLPRACWMSLAAWLAFTILGTEAWYRAHDRPAPASERWTVRWPDSRPNFQPREIRANVRRILSCDEAGEATWTEEDGSRWLMFFFEWHPSRSSTQSARAHRPEICLPATGRALIDERRTVAIPVGTQTIPFRTYLFDNHGQPLHVFFCLWEVGNRDRDIPGLAQNLSREARLQRVLHGQRNLGQQSLQVVVAGVDSTDEAEAAFRRLMREVIVPVRS